MLYTPGQGGAKQGASAHNGPGQFVATCGFLSQPYPYGCLLCLAIARFFLCYKAEQTASEILKI